MRIGIDATPLPRQPVGAGVYIIQIIRALAEAAGEDDLVVIAQPHGRQLIEAAGPLKVEWVSAPSLQPALRLVWEQIALPRLAKRLKLALLHSLHYTRPVFLPCRSVVTFHDLTFFLHPRLHTRMRRLYFPTAMRSAARRADMLIAVSEATRQDAIRILNISPRRIHTVREGVDAHFRPIRDVQTLESCRRRYNLPEAFLLYVGTVEPRKNLAMLIRAYAKQLSAGEAPPLVIVGRKGWMFEDVFRQVETLHLTEQVRFTGYIPSEDLPIVYNLAQVFVYPSLYEGFGFPPLEAMACGTPVITTSVSAIQEGAGEAALLVPPGDEVALAAALKRLIEDPDLQRDLAEKGPFQAAQFTWSRAAQETLDVYHRAAG